MKYQFLEEGQEKDPEKVNSDGYFSHEQQKFQWDISVEDYISHMYKKSDSSTTKLLSTSKIEESYSNLLQQLQLAQNSVESYKQLLQEKESERKKEVELKQQQQQQIIILQQQEKRKEEQRRVEQLQLQQKQQGILEMEQLQKKRIQEEKEEKLKREAAEKQQQLEEELEKQSHYSPFAVFYSEIKRKSSLYLNAQNKSECFKLKMLIHKRIGQISSSSSHLQKLSDEFMNLLNNSNKENDELYFYYAAITFIDNIVGQAYALVSFHSASAFPIGYFIFNICIRLRGLVLRTKNEAEDDKSLFLQKLLIGKFHTESKHTYFSVSEDEINSDASLDLQHEERLSGLISLFSALFVTNCLLGSQTQFSLENAWLWLASRLNHWVLKGPDRISALILITFLQISSHALLAQYRNQFRKCLIVIKEHLIHCFPKDSIAATTRLKIFIEEILQNNSYLMKEPEGFKLTTTL